MYLVRMSEHLPEEDRLRALERLDLLDTPPEADFNDLVSLASDLCGAPISLLTLLDRDRQWFKAAKGIGIRETERSLAFCDKALLQDDIFVVSDAQTDPRFADNPFVTGDPNIRFYAGALVHSPEGQKLGTLCIIDTRPRELSWREANILGKLARQATQLIEVRSRRQELEAARSREEALRARTDELQFQFQRLAHLSQLQNENLGAFFQNALDPLKTGRFTKKEIAEINEKAAAHREQVDAYNEALALLAAYRRQAGPMPAEAIRLLDFVQDVFPALMPLVKASGNRVQPYIPADLELRQNRAAVHLIFKATLGLLLGAVSKADISLVAKSRPDGVAFSISIPEHNLVEALQRYLPDAPQLGSEALTGRSFHVEVALLKDLIFEMGGNKDVHPLGNRGTGIELFLPHAF
ncbi:GAF domain-containing protein [Flaviaesturariibacter aridisoli]|uniref:GAF domain-containing protein n=2 Tax=Flaviaesturariibacter aridisoli TaxID=2545761 RepID=A0A4R4E2P8_9BACT|nr:GAF domain-containing protein [Flaviaesturariibacter aridisoli]